MAFRPLKAFGGFLDRMVPTSNYGGLLSPQDQRAAGQDMRAILASGLLSAAGPQRMPVSLGQALGGALPPAMAARDQRVEMGLRNDQLRREIERENRANTAQAKFGGLLRGIGGPEGDLLGSIADFSPQLAVGLLGAQAQQQAQRDPVDLQLLDALGLPRNQEGYAKLQSLRDSGDDRLKMLELQIATINASNLERTQAREEREEREARATQQVQITRSLEQTEKLADLAKKLEGSLVQTGLPAGDWRRQLGGLAAGAGAAFGINVKELESDLTAFDKYKKGLSDQLINLMATGDLGAGTNSKLAQYQDALAKPETELGAVLEIQANIARDLLDTATVKEFQIGGRDRYESLIEDWRNYESPEGEPSAAPVILRPPEIARMSLERIRALDIDSLNDEQRAALAKRLDELGL